MECRFCSLNAERQRVIARYSRIFVVASNPRLLLGHMLVIPEEHVVFPSELSDEEYCGLWIVARMIQTRILLRTPRMGCYVEQHSLPFLTNTEDTDFNVGHFHIHVIPRTPYDELYMEVQIHEKALFEKGFLSPEQMRQEEERLTRLYFSPRPLE